MSCYYYGGHENRNPIECDDISTPAGYFTLEEWERYCNEDYEEDRYEELKLQEMEKEENENENNSEV